MKILQINSSCGQGSTGRICTGIADMLKSYGHDAYIAYGHGFSDYPNSLNISGGKRDYLTHNILSRLTDSECLHSTIATKRLLNWIESIKPDIVHLHNLHGHYLNIEILFEYLHLSKIDVVMTLHDCWTFTGHCAHFDQYGCEKWKTECCNCQFLKAYPNSWFVDRSRRNFNMKKKLISQLGNRLTIVPVSYWLEGLVRQSFMKDLKIKTIHNGIDLTQFHPIHNDSLYDKYGVRGKKIILGVALPWSGYKGLPDFHKLRSMLSDEYAIIMVGLSEQQIAELPKGIAGITRTDSIRELAEIYTMADVLVNTTYCDNYPTVNLEAIACGTPVITYRTGGSPEAIDSETGMVVEQGDIDGIVKSVEAICNSQILASDCCLKRAKELFDKVKCFSNYLTIYNI